MVNDIMSTTMSTNRTPLKVVFFGTPEFALPSLAVVHAEQNLLAVWTQPDRPKGRGNHVVSSPVKLFAQQHNVTVYEPTTLRRGTPDGDATEQILRTLAPDVAVVVAYGHIIPERLLHIPTHGFVNIHSSLLPQLRGASPVQSALLRGDTTTGVTIMVMDKGMDTGPILVQRTVPIPPAITAAILNNQLWALGASLLTTALTQYCQGQLTPHPQDESQATLCSLITKEDGRIDWNQNPQQIERIIRAFDPWPGTFTTCNGKRIKILRAHCDATGTLVIDTVQPEAKKPMPYTDFLRGNPECPLPPVLTGGQ